ncbi:hypothetical protein BDV96DRAFT_647843 [Lophiotrema nucula]|uniref:Uncharacterized protein n=1 Tax=Lophiotrema nucula TaxID=690887 RepID=A0A6A5Z3W3_9PLEO|nr:hypothetical protein BDV96DRAFT_647843 [Lophiotrema nucula]
MARSHSSYTASPTRHRSPQRSPKRRQPSEDGSQYEMDLDALGLNSTFESTELDGSHEPKLDVVDTSDIEGPEDFTMNMTYWMTADLPQAHFAQIRSRKEASADVAEIRLDDQQERSAQDTTEEGDQAVIEETTRQASSQADYFSQSPTVRANGTTDGKALSDSSMENEEKVMSYLSALPDTDVADAITSTPLRVTKQQTLQVPSAAASKARSLQATVEDSADTPRKPTQETIQETMIHHLQEPTTEVNLTHNDLLQQEIADLQSRLAEQERSSKNRITELETSLSFTRTELDTARTASNKYKDQIEGLQRETERLRQTQNAEGASVGARLKQQEQEFITRMEEFGEELRLQNLAKLQSQREDFERQLRSLEDARRVTEQQADEKDLLLERSKKDLDQVQKLQQEELQAVIAAHTTEQQQREARARRERDELDTRLSSLQTRADTLQADLERATAETKTAREEAQANAALHSSSQFSAHSDTSRIAELESKLRSLQSQLESSRADATAKDQQILRNFEEQERIEQRLNTAQGRIEGLETSVSTLRQQLAEAHREGAKAKTSTERFENDLEAVTDRLQDARADADRRVADVEKKLAKLKESKTEVETRFKELQLEHEGIEEENEAKLENVREKAEDAVRKVGALLEQERKEKRSLTKELRRLNTDLERLRSEAAQKAAEQEEDSAEESILSAKTDSKDAEIENLRTLLRKQATAMKTVKSEIASLRKENKKLKKVDFDEATLRQENGNLKAAAETMRHDFEAINKQMDERLTVTLRKVLKERAKGLVGKRDEQWVDNVGRLHNERELMGKVLMREWGRQECGVAEEGEKQQYRYKYVQRSG